MLCIVADGMFLNIWDLNKIVLLLQNKFNDKNRYWLQNNNKFLVPDSNDFV